MRMLRTLGVLWLLTTFVVAVPGTASARRLSSSEQNFTATWNDLDFGGALIQCEVIIGGVLHSRVIDKVPGSLIGFVTTAAVGPCDAGGMVILDGNGGRPQTLPWHIQYDSFIGRLPAITGIRVRLVGMSALITFGVVDCLYRSTAALPAFGILNRNTATGVITGLRADEAGAIPLFSELLNDGAIPCPATGTLSGAAAVAPQIAVTLI